MTAEQHSKDLHAIVSDLKKALITGSGKWLSTGVSKNGDTSTQYAYFDELNGWNDIDVYVPFASPNTIQEEDIRIGTYMLTQSSKEALPALEKAYKKLVDDRAVADSTIAAYAKKGGKFKKDSALLSTVEAVLGNLFQLQSYADYNTWTKLIRSILIVLKSNIKELVPVARCISVEPPTKCRMPWSKVVLDLISHGSWMANCSRSQTRSILRILWRKAKTPRRWICR